VDSIREGTLLWRAVCFREGSLWQSRWLGSTQLQDLVSSACGFGNHYLQYWPLFVQSYSYIVT